MIFLFTFEVIIHCMLWLLIWETLKTFIASLCIGRLYWSCYSITLLIINRGNPPGPKMTFQHTYLEKDQIIASYSVWQVIARKVAADPVILPITRRVVSFLKMFYDLCSFFWGVYRGVCQSTQRNLMRYRYTRFGARMWGFFLLRFALITCVELFVFLTT